MNLTWWDVFRVALVVLSLANVIMVSRRGMDSRAVISALSAFVLALAFSLGLIPPAWRFFIGAALDLYVLVAVLRAASTGREGAIAGAIPRPLVRLVLTEIRLAAFAAAAPRLIVSTRTKGPETYSETSKWESFAVIALVAFVPDAVLLLFIPTPPWVHVVLIALSAYSTMWLVGAFGSVVLCPHELGSDPLLLKNGIFSELEVPAASIMDASVVPEVDRRGVLRQSGIARAMLAPGAPLVKVSLRGPIAARTLFGKPKIVQDADVYVASDDPAGLASLLRSRRADDVPDHSCRAVGVATTASA